MPSLVAVCQAHAMNISEEQRRYEIQVRRRRARFERYRDKCNRKIESYSRDNAVNVSYDGSRLEVRVQNPLTHLPEDGGRYTTYEVALETSNISFTLSKSYVRRRFSEFVWLRKYLKKHYGDITPAELPSRTLWGGQFDPAIIELRLHGLQTFLKAILLERLYLSDKALHLFVQSELSTLEIEEVAEGRDTTAVIDHVLRSSHMCRSSSRCSTCSEGDMTSDDGSFRVSTSSSDSDHSFLNAQCDTTKTESAPKTDDAGSGASCTTGQPATSSPRRSVSDSAICLHMPNDLTDSSASDVSRLSLSSKGDDESDSSTSSSSTSEASVSSVKKSSHPSVLSRSLPTGQVNHSCVHRRRRVTFSTEVTVAKVVEKVEEAEEGQTVSIVTVRKGKDKTKGH